MAVDSEFLAQQRMQSKSRAGTPTAGRRLSAVDGAIMTPSDFQSSGGASESEVEPKHSWVERVRDAVDAWAQRTLQGVKWSSSIRSVNMQGQGMLARQQEDGNPMKRSAHERLAISALALL